MGHDGLKSPCYEGFYSLGWEQGGLNNKEVGLINQTTVTFLVLFTNSNTHFLKSGD